MMTTVFQISEREFIQLHNNCFFTCCTFVSAAPKIGPLQLIIYKEVAYDQKSTSTFCMVKDFASGRSVTESSKLDKETSVHLCPEYMVLWPRKDLAVADEDKAKETGQWQQLLERIPSAHTILRTLPNLQCFRETRKKAQTNFIC